MARTSGAKDKTPRRRKHPLPGGRPLVSSEKKYGQPLTKMVEIIPSNNELLLDGVNPRAVYASGDAPGIYYVDMEIYFRGSWMRRKQAFAIVEQSHDVLNEVFAEPFLTSPIFPLHVRRIYAEGTTATKVMVLY